MTALAGPLTNWSGNHVYGAGVLHRPETFEELRRLAATAPSLHALASRHAFSAMGDAPELVAFDRLEAASLLELEPPVHTRLRGLVNRAFVSRQVERLRSRIEALSHSLVDAVEKDGEADLLPAFATPL